MRSIQGNWQQDHNRIAYVYTVQFDDERVRYCYETLRFLMTLDGSWSSVIDARDFFNQTSPDMTFITRDDKGDQVIEIVDHVISTTALPFRIDDVKAICDSWTESFFRGVPLDDILGLELPR